MNSRELLSTYPKAASIIRSWFLNKMMEAMATSDAPDDFKAQMKERGIADDMLVPIIEKNPSTLFKTFDDLGVYIEVPLVVEPNKVMFTYDIFVNGIYPFGAMKYDTRLEAESDAIENAMSYVNEHDELIITEEVK
jgi:hypothetical protein